MPSSRQRSTRPLSKSRRSSTLQRFCTAAIGVRRKRFVELARVDVREADAHDLAFVAQPHELADGVRQRHGRIDGVQVVQRNRRAEIRERSARSNGAATRAAVDFPAPVGAREPAFGRDDDVAALGCAQRFRDEPFVVAEVGLVEAIADRRIDEVAAACEERLDDGERRALVGPVLDRERHAAEADRARR